MKKFRVVKCGTGRYLIQYKNGFLTLWQWENYVNESFIAELKAIEEMEQYAAAHKPLIVIKEIEV